MNIKFIKNVEVSIITFNENTEESNEKSEQFLENDILTGTIELDDTGKTIDLQLDDGSMILDLDKSLFICLDEDELVGELEAEKFDNESDEYPEKDEVEEEVEQLEGYREHKRDSHEFGSYGDY